MTMFHSEKIKNSIYGFILGDILGVPVEFSNRERLKYAPVYQLLEYGSHNQPIGTWSDDTSLLLATLDSFSQNEDYYGLMNRFVDFLYNENYTPHGDVFDIGNTTSVSIRRYKEKNTKPEYSGETDIHSNGNGSLMRILPVAFSYNDIKEIDYYAQKISSLTHAHEISKICCSWYCIFINYLINNSFCISLLKTNEYILNNYPNSSKFLDRILTNKILFCTENEIKSSGYVVDSLEAALWASYNGNSYKDSVIKAVNLGEDTDTIGAITGSIAGIIYGNLPNDWLEKIVKKQYIDNIIENFLKKGNECQLTYVTN